MGKILITGASGNVGHYVAQYARKFGQDIVVAGTHLDMLKNMFNEDAEIVYLDFMDPATFPSALKNVDRVFIMRPPHMGKPEDFYPFICALKELNTIQLVCFLSLLGVEKNPIVPHHKIEKYIEQANLPFAHIRPSFFMQNISGIHAFEIRHFNKLVVPVKHAVTSFIDAQDIGEITAKILSEPELYKNKGYSITGYEAIDYWEVASILSKELGRTIVYTNPSLALAKKYWVKIRGLDPSYCNVMQMLYVMTRLNGAKKITSTFQEIMEKKPQSFHQFVKRNKNAW